MKKTHIPSRIAAGAAGGSWLPHPSAYALIVRRFDVMRAGLGPANTSDTAFMSYYERLVEEFSHIQHGQLVG